MSAVGFTIPLPDGTTFVAKDRVAEEPPLLGSLKNDEEGRLALRQFFFQRFGEAVADKKPETERLKVCSQYYDGFHWNTPELNRKNKVTNYCFSTVETVVPSMTETKPRPEIVLRRDYGDPAIANALQDFATWIMDSTNFDRCHVLNTREKMKYGWCVHLPVVDRPTGIAHPVPVSVFDYYKDATAESDDEQEHFFIARPVPTDWLIEQFPDMADQIVPDSVVSPSYEVYKQKFYDYWTDRSGYGGNESVVAYMARFESQPATGATTALVNLDGRRQTGGRTTFLIQGFFRDRSRVPVYYTGDIAQKVTDETGGETFEHVPSMKAWRTSEPACESGWRVVQFTIGGVFLSSAPLDPCFGGNPVVIGRDYPQLGRFYCPGELDHIIPINRSINRRHNLLNESLEYEALPLGVLDEGVGTNVDKAALYPGDVLRKSRGSEVKWVSFDGVSSQQFEMLTIEKMDVEQISGVSDVQQGRRPAGIEAAAAIRSLQDAAQVRVRGKENPAFMEYAELLKKLMVATGRKCKNEIFYRASDGITKSIDRRWLLYEYDIRFAEGSGTAIGRAMQEEKVLTLQGAGLMDPQSALERMGVKGVGQVIERLGQMQAVQAVAGGGPPPPNQ